MASIFKKGAKWWCRLRGLKKPDKWGNAPTPYKATQENADRALRYAETAQKKISARASVGGPMTIAKFAMSWLDKRDDQASSADDRGRIVNHVLPAIGHLLCTEVQPMHIADMVIALNRNEDLAPRTVLNIFGIARTMFRDIRRARLIDENPCEPPPPELPEKMDKDPEWRDLATYEMPEVIALVSDPRVPPERRLQYAMKAMSGLRHGEVAGIRWRNYDESEVPLGKFSIARSYNNRRTKTKVTRLIPVHAELARMLHLWRTIHWPRIHGRVPAADDLIVPTRTMKPISANDAGRYFKVDLKALGLRVPAGEERDRGGHDLRAWFISTCIEHGADPIVLQRVTHTKPKDVMSGYTRLPYHVLCGAIAKLPIVLVENPLELATDFATRETSAALRWRNMATPTGFEPKNNATRRRQRAQGAKQDAGLVTSCDVSLSQLVAKLAPSSEGE